MRLLLNSYLCRITIMQTKENRNLKNEPRLYIVGCFLFVCVTTFARAAGFFPRSTRNFVSMGWYLPLSNYKNCFARFFSLFLVLLLPLRPYQRLLLPSLFLEAPACEPLLIHFFENRKKCTWGEKTNKRINSTTWRKKTGQRDAVLCFIELLPGWLVCVCVFYYRLVCHILLAYSNNMNQPNKLRLRAACICPLCAVVTFYRFFCSFGSLILSLQIIYMCYSLFLMLFHSIKLLFFMLTSSLVLHIVL